jgi:hypothetical protein
MSELRRLYWWRRYVNDGPEMSRTHLFPMDRHIALCGVSLNGSGWPMEVCWDDSGNPEHLCKRCRKIENKENENGGRTL